jgi:hypothetical protein
MLLHQNRKKNYRACTHRYSSTIFYCLSRCCYYCILFYFHVLCLRFIDGDGMIRSRNRIATNAPITKINICIFITHIDAFYSREVAEISYYYFYPWRYRLWRTLGRLSSRRWLSFPTAPDGTGLTCGQHIESHSCIFSFPNRGWYIGNNIRLKS